MGTEELVNIDALVRDAFSAALASGKVVDRREIVQALMRQHPHVHGDDAALAKASMRFAFDVKARAHTREHRAGDDADGEVEEQELLPGFERVLKHYPMKRNGAVVLVPAALMTIDDWRAQEKMRYAFARGNEAHARECRRIVDMLEAAGVETLGELDAKAAE